MEPTFKAYLVRKDAAGQVQAGVTELPVSELPAGEVLIRVHWSSLNYKDALAATGHPGVARKLPHVPGIDAAGIVESSDSNLYRPGDQVLVTGYGLGEHHWGGFAELVRVPAEWVVPLPAGLSLREAMIYGTAGFTAAQSVTAIIEREIDSGRGPVLVTGATGGVGILSVALLAKNGFEVAAVTGKPEHHELLRRLGAKQIVGRDEVNDTTDRPLLGARWSSAVDTVGGNILATILRSTEHRGVVAACGLVAGAELSLTVYPFILRGVSLVGIDSAKCPREHRLEMWRRLSGPWKIDALESLATAIPLAGVGAKVQEILAGRVVGRTIIDMQATN